MAGNNYLTNGNVITLRNCFKGAAVGLLKKVNAATSGVEKSQ